MSHHRTSRPPSHVSARLPLAAALLLLSLPAIAAPAPTYERDVLPLFRARCGGCHGTAQPQAGLDISRVGDLREGGYSGPALVPGAPRESLLYRLLESGSMPRGGRRLTAAELHRVRQWIETGAHGAPGGGHWAFRPPHPPPLPRVRAAERVRNPVDRFVLAGLERRGLTLAPPAAPQTLIRRLTFDLTGLPPTPEEVESFLRDWSGEAESAAKNAAPGRERQEAAYRRLVDRLLASPAYGERWARHWLDPAGYADSEGVLQEDRIRPNAWRYRDYVIRSLNEDKPYDRFLREQLAGDEMVDYRRAPAFTEDVLQPLIATGFLRTAVDGTRDDFNPHQYGEYQYRMLHDVQTIVSSTVLGLTIQCSRCHSHKYEPISQRDYYRLQAVFQGAVRPRGTLVSTARRQIVAATAEEQQRAKEVNTRVDADVGPLNTRQLELTIEYRLRYLDAEIGKVPAAEQAPLRAAVRLPEAKRSAEQKALVARHRALVEPAAEALGLRFPEFARRQREITSARAAAESRRVTLPSIRAFYDQDANPPLTPILQRGDWLRPGEAVGPGIPAVLARVPFRLQPPSPDAASTGRRRALAEWVTHPAHPLTARVMANRVWAHHFGSGIVSTLDNFGRSGRRPTNPELLDYLACGFAGGDYRLSGGDRAVPWSVKALHQVIVTSAAYRQASGWRPAAAAVDPENALLWRQRPRRLEAEAVRDAMLAAAGTLDTRLYGEPVALETRPTGEHVPAGEEGAGRRSIYLLVRRTQPVHLLNAFDAPVMETNCPRRVSSTTAVQALALMNGGFVSAQSRAFGRRVLQESGGTLGRPLVERAVLRALGRPPTPGEAAAALDFLRAQEARYRSRPGAAPGSALEAAAADFCQALLGANEFVYVD